MDFIIKPYEGVEVPGRGVIRFDMTREEVRRFFAEEPYTRMREGKDGSYEFHQYENDHIAFTFDPSGKLYRIEGTRSSRIFLDGTLISDLIYRELMPFLQSKDAKYSILKSKGVLCLTLGLFVFAEGPVRVIESRPPTAIILCRRGSRELSQEQ